MPINFNVFSTPPNLSVMSLTKLVAILANLTTLSVALTIIFAIVVVSFMPSSDCVRKSPILSLAICIASDIVTPVSAYAALISSAELVNAAVN